MTRPAMIRADTMDLQARDAPSAANHNHTPGDEAKRNGNSIKVVEHDLISGSSAEYEDGQKLDGATLVDESDITDTDEDDLMNAEFSSTSPSIDNEDIDFEFVYALHTFTATVEGQANALKGDTMVLLDDSNSYWWLVRIVKDSSIGYLPAEHIETPSERLARLNKHRNMDLAMPMLSDSSEQAKNPLNRVRDIYNRRGKKPRNVTFTSPFSTTVEYFDVESSEEEGDGEYLTNDEDEGEQNQTEDADEITAIESKPKPTIDTKPKEEEAGPGIGRVSIANELRKDLSPLETKNRVTSELEKVEQEAKPKKNGIRSGNGAFFPDDGIETKKITLTPQVARERDENDSANSSPISTASKEAKSRGSLEKSLGRDSPPPGKDKEKKSRKGGVLGNLFKKRGKGKKAEDEIDDFLHGSEKKSIDSTRSVETAKEEEERKAREAAEKAALAKEQEERDWQEKVENQRKQQLQNELDQHRRFEEKQAQKQAEIQRQREATMAAANRSIAEAAKSEPDRNIERKASDSYFDGAVKPLRLVTERNGSMDDNATTTSSRYATPTSQYTAYSPAARNASTPTSQQKVFSAASSPQKPTRITDRERLSESPEEVTYEDAEQPPALDPDNSGDEADHSSSPEIIDSTSAGSPNGINNGKSDVPVWSDTGLRNFFDDSNTEVADMLVRIHDTSDLPPVTEHPLVTPLFQEARDKLADINNRLDNLFMSFLRSRGRM